MENTVIETVKQINDQLRKLYKDNEQLSPEGWKIINNVYDQEFTTNFKLLKKSEAMKELGLKTQKELSDLISQKEIAVIKIAGRIRVPSWSIFPYKHKNAFKLSQNIYDEAAYEEFVRDFDIEAEEFFYTMSEEEKFYSMYDLMKIFRLPHSIVFKLIGSNYIKPIFGNDQIYFCPHEVYCFLDKMMYGKDFIIL